METYEEMNPEMRELVDAQEKIYFLEQRIKNSDAKGKKLENRCRDLELKKKKMEELRKRLGF